MSKNILITGTSSGFGHLIVNTLLDKGYTVIASMRNINTHNRTQAQALKRAGAIVVEIDVTDENSVSSGIADALDQAGSIDVVINNAGIGVLGLQECFTDDDWSKIFDVNVLGVQRVCRAVLPQMRAQKQGLLITLSSTLGRMTFPFFGPYNASKWAVEALAENYRVELSGFGIESCLIEPGGFPTAFFGRINTPSDTSRDKSYGDMVNAPQALLEGFGEALKETPEQDPQLVADAVLNLLETAPGARAMRTVVDTMGIADAMNAYNDEFEKLLKGQYNALGMGDMLKLST